MHTRSILLKTTVFFVLLLVLCLGSPFHASFSQESSAAVIDDVFLLVDNSGSMHQWIDSNGTHPGSDPLDLRATAARIFVDLLYAGDRLGVAAFATEPVDLLSAVGLKGIVDLDEEIRGKIKSAILIGTKTPTGFTDIAQALAFAETELLAKKAEGHRQSIIIFTDGLPTKDPHPNVPVLVDEVEKAAQQAISKDIAIYSVGLKVDDPSMSPEYIKQFQDMLGRIATISIDQTHRGGTFIVKEAIDLNDVFVKTLKEIKSQYLRTIEGNSTNIEITPYTRKIMVVSPRSNDTEHCTVIDPSGLRLDPTAFDPNYELFSIDHPTEGSWVVQPPSGVKTILWVLEELTVTTDLKVEARKYFAGDPVPFTAEVNPVDVNAALNYGDFGLKVLITSVNDPNRIVATVEKPEVLNGKTWQGTWNTGGLPPGDYSLTVGLVIKGGEAHRGASRIVTLLPKAVINAEGRNQDFAILRKGGSYIFAVKFTSPQPSTVAFQLSKELQPYISIEPNATKIEVANKTQEVIFTLAPAEAFPVEQPVLGQLLFSTSDPGFEISPPGYNIVFHEKVTPIIIQGGPFQFTQHYGTGQSSYPLQLAISCSEPAHLAFSLSSELQPYFSIEPQGITFDNSTTPSTISLKIQATTNLPTGQGFDGFQYGGALFVDSLEPGFKIEGNRIELAVLATTWWQEYWMYPGIPLIVLVLALIVWLVLWLRVPAPRGRIALIPAGKALTTPGGKIILPPGCPERNLNQRTFLSKLVHKSWVSVGSTGTDIVFSELGQASFKIEASSSGKKTGMRLNGRIRRTGRTAFLADQEVFYVQASSLMQKNLPISQNTTQQGSREFTFVYKT